MKAEIINIKKLKKDGTIDSTITRRVSDTLRQGKLVLMPIDCIYGVVSLFNATAIATVAKMTGEQDHTVVRMISSFKMLDEIASIDKMEFDFLHRIWPGELIVYVHDNKTPKTSIPVRMPKNKYHQDIINNVGRPLIYSAVNDPAGKCLFLKKDLISTLGHRVNLMLLIDEFCKEHTLPSVVDISSGMLTIVLEGRVPAEEIKSLYFLGKDDSAL